MHSSMIVVKSTVSGASQSEVLVCLSSTLPAAPPLHFLRPASFIFLFLMHILMHFLALNLVFVRMIVAFCGFTCHQIRESSVLVGSPGSPARSCRTISSARTPLSPTRPCAVVVPLRRHPVSWIPADCLFAGAKQVHVH